MRSVLFLLVAGCVCSSLEAMLPGEICGNDRDDDSDGFVDCFEALFDEIGGVVDLEVEVAVSTRSWGWKQVTKS